MPTPRIPYELLGPWSHRTPTSGKLKVSEADIIRSAALVGLPLLSSDPTRERPFLEMVWRAMMATTNLRTTKSGKRWTRSAAYDRLDPSEKVAVSYFLGMLQSHLMAQKLGYSHLVHVDRLLTLSGQKLSGKRPDFVAVSIGAAPGTVYGATWEAKGRTNGFDDAALTKAKIQAARTPTIAGLTPVETIASEAYFDVDDNTWRAKLKDPDWDGTYMKAGLETYLMAYYLPILAAAAEGGEAAVVDDVRIMRLPVLGLTVSIPEMLAEATIRSAQLELDEREQEGVMSYTFHALAEEIGAEWAPDLVRAELDDNVAPFGD